VAVQLRAKIGYPMQGQTPYEGRPFDKRKSCSLSLPMCEPLRPLSSLFKFWIQPQKRKETVQRALGCRQQVDTFDTSTRAGQEPPGGGAGPGFQVDQNHLQMLDDPDSLRRGEVSGELAEERITATQLCGE
jgi:hypothetical protein